MRRWPLLAVLLAVPAHAAAPTAAFTCAPLSGRVPLTVTCTDESTDGGAVITSWFWTFGDGGSSTEQSPTYEYTSAGGFQVSLLVENADGGDDEIKAGYVTVAPAVAPGNLPRGFRPCGLMVESCEED